MRRASLSGLSIATALAGARFSAEPPRLRAARTCFHYKSVSTDDPFGERASWDDHPTMATWKDVDFEAFADALQSPDVQRQHFGPDWSRGRSIANAAVRLHGAKFLKSRGGDARTPSTDADNEALSAAEAAAARQARRGENDESEAGGSSGAAAAASGERRLSDELSPRELAAAKVIMYSDAKMPSRGVDQVDYVASPPLAMEQLAGFRAPEALAVPKSIRGAQAGAPDSGEAVDAIISRDDSDVGGEDALEDEEASSVASAAPMTRDADGIPTCDPISWTTDDVIRWATRYGPAEPDLDLLEAIRMSAATGATLLNKVTPPDLFRAMRKWHLAGRAPRDDAKRGGELVSLTVLQETAILCFPYGPP
jgi:hypothetical protein